ncbi:hypothetical protein NKH77_35580 [Streptomyces sp. M19]
MAGRFVRTACAAALLASAALAGPAPEAGATAPASPRPYRARRPGDPP